ncbi:hypothetical protein IC232_04655 [Microvirga sp. BT688]|uniref:hypothetical protein n=1 Tax=Microvirga sp. TaxID=1873136 RepID=UPI0016890AAB|nr:hypothetical protein [Microvirga sp.]MBD2745986.1 hypothetical protein [Microvirga sp.]
MSKRPLPRLNHALSLAGFSQSEAHSAIYTRRTYKDDFLAASEAICHVGGATKAIQFALRCKRINLQSARSLGQA